VLAPSAAGSAEDFGGGCGRECQECRLFNEHMLMRTFLRGLLVDKAGVEAEFEVSNLDWTLVRPPMLTDPREDPHCQGASTEGGEKAHKIARADPAAFMVKELETSHMPIREPAVVIVDGNMTTYGGSRGPWSLRINWERGCCLTNYLAHF
jgi:NAD(P)H-binding